MPKFEITTPDGRRFEIEAPEGTSAEDALAWARQHLGAQGGGERQPTEAPREEPRQQGGRGAYVKGLARSAAQGATFGFGDEALARARSMFSDRDYDDLLQEERDAYKRFASENPVASFAAEFVGGAIPSIPALMIPGGQTAAGATLANTARNVGALTRMATSPTARLAATGAGYGGVAGFGAGEGGFGNRAESALGGAATGAVLGPLAAAGMNAVGRGYTGLIDRVAPNSSFADPIGRGRDYAIGQMARDNITLQDLQARLAKDRRMGVPAMVFDQGPNLRLGAEVAAMRGGEGQRFIQDLNERNVGNRARTMRQLNRALKPDDYFDAEDKILAKLRTDAAPYYDTAYAAAPAIDESPALRRLLNQPGAREIWQDAMGSPGFTLLGNKPGKMIWQDGERVLEKPSLEALDQFKRAVDRRIALIENATPPGAGTQHPDLAALREYRGRLMDAINESLPDPARVAWQEARGIYKGDLETRNALRMGRDEFYNMDPREMSRFLNDPTTTPAEREAMRTGVYEALRHRYRASTEMPNTPSGMDPSRNVAGNVINDAETREKLRALVGNDREADFLLAGLQRESEIFKGASRVTGGSPTEPRRVAGEEFEGKPSVMPELVSSAAGLATTSPAMFAANVGRLWNLSRSAASLPEARANEVIRIMRAGTPQEVQQVIRELEQHAQNRVRQANTTGRLVGATAADVAATGAETPYVPPEGIGQMP